MRSCRFGWYERGSVRRHVAGRHAVDVPADEPKAQASLRRHSSGNMVVEAEIDGSTWFGRLFPRKKGASEGPVILYQRVTEAAE